MLARTHHNTRTHTEVRVCACALDRTARLSVVPPACPSTPPPAARQRLHFLSLTGRLLGLTSRVLCCVHPCVTKAAKRSWHTIDPRTNTRCIYTYITSSPTTQHSMHMCIHKIMYIIFYPRTNINKHIHNNTFAHEPTPNAHIHTLSNTTIHTDIHTCMTHTLRHPYVYIHVYICISIRTCVFVQIQFYVYIHLDRGFEPLCTASFINIFDLFNIGIVTSRALCIGWRDRGWGVVMWS